MLFDSLLSELPAIISLDTAALHVNEFMECKNVKDYVLRISDGNFFSWSSNEDR